MVYAPRVSANILWPERGLCRGVWRLIPVLESGSPMRVMYIDGEMPAVTMQERLAAIVNSHEAEAETDALLIVTPDMQDGEPMPDLSTIEGQTAIAPCWKACV